MTISGCGCIRHLTTRRSGNKRSRRASRLVSLPIRLKHKAADDFQASLEEAAVRRPGREAGIKSDDTFERRRCGTAGMRIGTNPAISLQVLTEYVKSRFLFEAIQKVFHARGCSVSTPSRRVCG